MIATNGCTARYLMAHGGASLRRVVRSPERCTGQEDAVRKVERQVRKSEAALLLHDSIGHEYRAIVSGMNAQGVWVRIFTPPAEGRLIAELPDLRLGQQLQVQLISTSVERGFIDFSLHRPS